MATILNDLPYVRYVCSVSTGGLRDRHEFKAMMADNVAALRRNIVSSWTRATVPNVPGKLVTNDPTYTDGVVNKANSGSSETSYQGWETHPSFKAYRSADYDCFKQGGDFVDGVHLCGYLGIVAYRFTLPVADPRPLTRIRLAAQRSRYLRSGVRIAVSFSDSSDPTADWDTLRGEAGSTIARTPSATTGLPEGVKSAGFLNQVNVPYLLKSTAEVREIEFTSLDSPSIETSSAFKYLWVYMSVEDMEDYWTLYDEEEPRYYSIEGSAALVPSRCEFEFEGDAFDDNPPAGGDDDGDSSASKIAPVWAAPCPFILPEGQYNQSTGADSDATRQALGNFWRLGTVVGAAAPMWGVEKRSSYYDFTPGNSCYFSDILNEETSSLNISSRTMEQFAGAPETSDSPSSPFLAVPASDTLKTLAVPARLRWHNHLFASVIYRVEAPEKPSDKALLRETGSGDGDTYDRFGIQYPAKVILGSMVAHVPHNCSSYRAMVLTCERTTGYTYVNGSYGTYLEELDNTMDSVGLPDLTFNVWRSRSPSFRSVFWGVASSLVTTGGSCRYGYTDKIVRSVTNSGGTAVSGAKVDVEATYVGKFTFKPDDLTLDREDNADPGTPIKYRFYADFEPGDTIIISPSFRTVDLKKFIMCDNDVIYTESATRPYIGAHWFYGARWPGTEILSGTPEDIKRQLTNESQSAWSRPVLPANFAMDPMGHRPLRVAFEP